MSTFINSLHLTVQLVGLSLHLKQRRRILTEQHLSITLGICELSFI